MPFPPVIATRPLTFGTTGDVPLSGVKESIATPPPDKAIEILLGPFVIATPTPAVKVAAEGTPAVDPMISCPSVASAVSAGTPVAFVVSTALLAVARPVTVFVALE
jgi:hypothetical protein